MTKWLRFVSICVYIPVVAIATWELLRWDVRLGVAYAFVAIVTLIMFKNPKEDTE